jgi:hypothetical protein
VQQAGAGVAVQQDAGAQHEFATQQLTRHRRAQHRPQAKPRHLHAWTASDITNSATTIVASTNPSRRIVVSPVFLKPRTKQAMVATTPRRQA